MTRAPISAISSWSSSSRSTRLGGASGRFLATTACRASSAGVNAGGAPTAVPRMTGASALCARTRTPGPFGDFGGRPRMVCMPMSEHDTGERVPVETPVPKRRSDDLTLAHLSGVDQRHHAAVPQQVRLPGSSPEKPKVGSKVDNVHGRRISGRVSLGQHVRR